ncbi:peroxiredoxin family protein [Thalassolituus sp. LLYu03]|uniref:peroxiredoxin family protein n=1 Tax=Thalassolituus sp. LLYu03 TaxID=3421656 RepID=UPI003D2906D3
MTTPVSDSNSSFSARDVRQLRAGDYLPAFALPALDGSVWSTEQLAGRKALVVFFRFASCPFCNLRLHKLIQLQAQLPADFAMVAVFDSSAAELRPYAERHSAPFPVLADEGAAVHRQYGVRYSWWGVLKGMVTRLPTALYSMLAKGYWPTAFSGALHTMPMNFLVNADGRIATAYYGADEGDHLPLEDILSFI